MPVRAPSPVTPRALHREDVFDRTPLESGAESHAKERISQADGPRAKVNANEQKVCKQANQCSEQHAPQRTDSEGGEVQCAPHAPDVFRAKGKDAICNSSSDAESSEQSAPQSTSKDLAAQAPADGDPQVALAGLPPRHPPKRPASTALTPSLPDWSASAPQVKKQAQRQRAKRTYSRQHEAPCSDGESTNEQSGQAPQEATDLAPKRRPSSPRLPPTQTQPDSTSSSQVQSPAARTDHASHEHTECRHSQRKTTHSSSTSDEDPRDKTKQSARKQLLLQQGATKHEGQSAPVAQTESECDKPGTDQELRLTADEPLHPMPGLWLPFYDRTSEGRSRQRTAEPSPRCAPAS